MTFMTFDIIAPQGISDWPGLDASWDRHVSSTHLVTTSGSLVLAEFSLEVKPLPG